MTVITELIARGVARSTVEVTTGVATPTAAHIIGGMDNTRTFVQIIGPTGGDTGFQVRGGMAASGPFGALESVSSGALSGLKTDGVILEIRTPTPFYSVNATTVTTSATTIKLILTSYLING